MKEPKRVNLSGRENNSNCWDGKLKTEVAFMVVSLLTGKQAKLINCFGLIQDFVKFVAQQFLQMTNFEDPSPDLNQWFDWN